MSHMDRNRQGTLVHFLVLGLPRSVHLCGVGYPHHDASVSIDLVTCAPCREKYFGMAGTDPLSVSSSITD